jgi:hypothetical protein
MGYMLFEKKKLPQLHLQAPQVIHAPPGEPPHPEFSLSHTSAKKIAEQLINVLSTGKGINQIEAAIQNFTKCIEAAQTLADLQELIAAAIPSEVQRGGFLGGNSNVLYRRVIANDFDHKCYWSKGEMKQILRAIDELRETMMKRKDVLTRNAVR